MLWTSQCGRQPGRPRHSSGLHAIKLPWYRRALVGHALQEIRRDTRASRAVVPALAMKAASEFVPWCTRTIMQQLELLALLDASSASMR